jgi:hypothetical protein
MTWAVFGSSMFAYCAFALLNILLTLNVIGALNEEHGADQLIYKSSFMMLSTITCSGAANSPSLAGKQVSKSDDS